MTTIKEKYHCHYCGKRVFVPNLRTGKQYCSERCQKLHEDFITKHTKV